MASFYGSARSLSSRRHNLSGIIGILRHQREALAAQPAAAHPAKPGALKLAILAARAAAELPLFPEGR